jgi:hypothetical protein
MSNATPELVTTELPEELERMAAAIQRAKEERAVAAAIEQDIFLEPVSLGTSCDIKDVDVDLNFNNENDLIDQNLHLYDVDATHTRDRHGRHYWNFDDRRRMPLLVIAFRTKGGAWLCTVNDVIMRLDKFLSITDAQAAPVQRREFGAPPTVPSSTEQLLCNSGDGERFAIPYASVSQLMMALQMIPVDPENDGVPRNPTAKTE